MTKERSPKRVKKMRLDELLFTRGLAESISKARAIIMSGSVSLRGVKVDKAGFAVAPDAEIILKQKSPYVGRGGLKLAGLLDETGFSPEGLSAIDVGSSTGGFTDCLLQRGAILVHAVDVGVGIIDWRLRTDKRVVLHEGTNIRALDASETGAPLDLAVMDLSFISLKKVLPMMRDFIKSGGRVFALIKPQFEASREDVGKGGVVRSSDVQRAVVEDIKAFSIDSGFTVLSVVESPVKGAKGNREFWIDLEVL